MKAPFREGALMAILLLSCRYQSTHSWQGHWASTSMPGRRRRQQSILTDFRAFPGVFTSRQYLRFRHVDSLKRSMRDGNNDKPELKRNRRGFSALLSRVKQSKIRSSASSEVSLAEADRLRRENALLREAVKQLEAENEKLHSANRIVLETFEGEGKIRKASETGGPNGDKSPVTLTGEEMLFEADDTSLWCDELEEGACPVEPTVSFGEALRDRAYWLVGLLVLQSLSGIILAKNEALLAEHPVIIYFLTMLVGAGGNAGNQASVRVIRGLALGTLNDETQGQFLTREVKMAFSLSGILSTAGFLRAAAFHTPAAETMAVTAALGLIVFSSICLGAVLPLLLKRLGVDPAHSSTTIQVIMDILGVVLAVVVSNILLDSPFGHLLVGRMVKALHF